MDYSYLVGYKFGVIWEGEQSIEEYTIVSSNANISNNEVNVDTLFVRSLYEKNKGDVCNSNGNKFIIEYIVCPSFDNVVKERNIKHLYHFSALENINSIMQNGILSIDMLRRLNIKYDFNDNFRLDKIETNYIKKIIFESEDDEKDFKNKYNTIVNPKMFDYRDKFLGYKMKFN